MNNLLLILGMIALSNGNINLFENKNKSNLSQSRKNKDGKKSPRRPVKSIDEDIGVYDDIFKFDMNDVKHGMKLLDLSDEDLERGMEIITRTKKYMSTEEQKVLIKIESVLDLVRGIKKLNSVDILDDVDESNFFRSMDEEDKKNMMIKEILEVFPETRKGSVEKAIGMKKKIELFAELFLPDDIGENGFSLSSLANISNLGSMGNLKLLGSLLRGDEGSKASSNSNYKEDVYEYEEDDYEYEEYEEDDYEEDVYYEEDDE